jgi:hypothetical protein
MTPSFSQTEHDRTDRSGPAQRPDGVGCGADESDTVNRVHDDLDETTKEFAETLALKPPLAVQAIEDAAKSRPRSVSMRKGRPTSRRPPAERLTGCRTKR